MSDYRDLLELSPGYAPALRELGRSLAVAERNLEARPLLERAVVADPKHSGAWNNLGVVAQKVGDLARAVAAFGQAEEAGFSDPGLWARRGIARFELARSELAQPELARSEFAAAINDLERALRAEVEWPEVYSALGQSQLASGDRAAARVTFAKALAKFPDHAELRARGAEADRAR